MGFLLINFALCLGSGYLKIRNSQLFDELKHYKHSCGLWDVILMYITQYVKLKWALLVLLALEDWRKEQISYEKWPKLKCRCICFSITLDVREKPMLHACSDKLLFSSHWYPGEWVQVKTVKQWGTEDKEVFGFNEWKQIKHSASLWTVSVKVQL